MNLNQVIAIDFQYCLITLRQKLGWIIIGTVASLLVGGIVINQMDITDSYRATATVYSFVDGDTGSTVEGTNALQVYSETIKSQKIAEMAAALLGSQDVSADEIYDMLSTDSRYIVTSTVRYTNESVVIPVYADSQDYRLCVSVANAAADSFVEEINQLLGSDTIRVLDYADKAEIVEDGEKKSMIYLAIFAVGGCFLTAAWILLRVILSSRVQTMKDVSLYEQIKVLGVFPEKGK